MGRGRKAIVLNRHKWNAALFHKTLAELVGASSGNKVLDLGCGSGASLGPLLDSVGVDGVVHGLDKMTGSLETAAANHVAAMEAGRLCLTLGDVSHPPFPDGFFDAVVCQNVVECVHDREGLVTQARRILKPGGRLLLGHHDFDGIILAADDRDLTRRLVHGFADFKQAWQDEAEGRMGRLIPGLVANAGFASIELETRIFVDLDLAEGSYARDYVGWLVDTAPTLGVARDEVANWRLGLEAACSEGRFFFGLPWVAAICRGA